MTTPRPFALRLFVPSGLPEGMRIVEKTNWSGIGYVIPRSQLKEFTQRPEAGRPGVYVLTGPDPEDGGADLAYIGTPEKANRKPDPDSRGERGVGSSEGPLSNEQ